MTPHDALQFLCQWTRESLPLKHIDTYNQAFVMLSQLIAAAQENAKPKVAEAANG